MQSPRFHAPPSAAVPNWDIDPYAREVLCSPAAWYAGLRARGPLVWLTRYGCWAAGRYADVRVIFGDWERFSSARGVGLADFYTETPWRAPSIVLEADPPGHERARRAILRALTPRAVAGLEAAFADEARRLVQRLLATGAFDAVTDCAEAFPLSVFPDAVGITADDRRKLLTYGRMVFNALGPDNDLRRASLAAAGDVVPWIEAHCRRDALSGPGFAETIYTAADDGEISPDEAALLVRSLLSAGIDTTVAGLGAVLHLLALNPDAWDALRARPELARNAFEEALRLVSPVHAFYRTATRATEVGGVPVAEGAKIMCVLGAANTDPARWPDPGRFDITRDTSGHVAFGVGIHACVGQHVARAEALALLGAMRDAVARIEPLGPVRWRPGNALRTLAAAPMRWSA